jgi:hypothetical protein
MTTPPTIEVILLSAGAFLGICAFFYFWVDHVIKKQDDKWLSEHPLPKEEGTDKR